MRHFLLVFISILLATQSSQSFANLDGDLQASCKKWQLEAKALESGIIEIDNDEFSLNGGIPGLMFYGMVISPFLSGSDFLFGSEFRENIYENHKNLVDILMISTIPFVIFPYTLALNAKVLTDKVAVKKFLKIKLAWLEKKIQSDCSGLDTLVD